MSLRHDESRHAHRGVRSVGVALALTLVLAACSNSEDGAGAATTELRLDDVAALSGDAAPASFEVRPSVEQVVVTGADHGDELALYSAAGEALAIGTADEQGSLIFREVEPADGLVVASATGDEQQASEPIEVLSVEGSTPPQSFYEDQELVEGFQYIETRDGTTLSASVFLPGPIEDGPYPTVVEYSGYSPSKPAKNLIEERFDDLKESLPVEDITLEQVCALAPFACEAPDQPGSLIAHAMGYAVVAVNMRGTGCSGGSYDFFEPLQLLDGYDVIETVAAQPWVKDNAVGMVGLSYPGLSQLFVASTNPPSLAAIAPMSVYDDTARGVLSPGGIFNDGFALQWADEVLTSAEPYGQGWEQELVDAGDTECEQNQLLRGQNVDVVAKAQSFDHYEPSVADPLNPSLFVDRIDVPVFLTGSFQDEQTGGRFPLLFERFTNAPVARFTAANGAHSDGLAPYNLVEFKTFLDLYVGGELTERSLPFELFAPVIMGEVFGVEMQLPPQRLFEDQPDLASQRAAYESEDPIRIVFESGAGDPENPGTPAPTLDIRVPSWPLPDTTTSVWYLGPDGTLSAAEPDSSGGSSVFAVDPELAKRTTFVQEEGNDLFRADVRYDWQQEPDGSASVFVTEPLTDDLVMVGTASADLWIRSSHDEADLGVTLSEVRPDGKETYIQSGTLRGSHRRVAADSTELLPLQSNLESDAEALPTDEFVEARIAIFPFAHVVRAGSRIRLSVHTPGGDRARWTYILADHPDDATVEIGHDAQHPSRLVLPSVAGISGYPAQVPTNCNALRAQPCRTFRDYANTPGDG